MATPAIPISTAPQSNKLQRIYPAGARSKPAGARPTPNKTQFPLRKLLAVPKRLLFPPPTTSVGHVRSFGSTSLSNIKLEEVLANKYLAPLSLRDFEGHLVFREYSAENLYFLLWLNEYTKEWEAYKADSSHLHHTLASTLTHDPNEGAARHLPDHLAASLEKGLAVFFTPNGPLELNLSANTRECVLNSAGRSGDPADFQDARSQVEAGLNRSLLVHCHNSTANAGPHRLVFCFLLGLTVFLLGLIPVFVGIFGDHARGWRAIGLPFFFLGSAISVMALKRVCAVIWLLGEDRQLLPWELHPPTVNSGTLVDLGSSPSTPGTAHSDWDEEKGDQKSYQTANSAVPHPWETSDSHPTDNAINIDFDPNSTTKEESSAIHRPPSYVSGKAHSTVSPAGVWAPVCAVSSPEITRSQWIVVVYGFCAGFLIMCLLSVVVMAVPNQ